MERRTDNVIAPSGKEITGVDDNSPGLKKCETEPGIKSKEERDVLLALQAESSLYVGSGPRAHQRYLEKGE